VPLSEHEQRLLDQIERALYAEDPKFATTVRSTDLRTHMKRRRTRAIVLGVIGVLLLVGGPIVNPLIGIAGFVVMLGALLMGVSAWKRLNGSTATPLRSVDGGTTRTPGKGPSRKARSHGSPRERLEDRWKKRWDERGRPE
jgi:hypothetical protein